MMNKILKQSKSSENIIHNFETFKNSYTNGLNEQFNHPRVATETSDDLTNVKERVLVLELNLNHAIENFKKDLELLCVELSNQCEQNTLRTQINEDNISSMNTNYQEIVGQYNQMLMQLNEVKNSLSESKEKRRSFIDNFFWPFILCSTVAVLSFFLGKFMAMTG